MGCIFGDGTTVTFSLGGFPALLIKSIDQIAFSSVSEDATPLGQAANTYAANCFGNRIKHEPVSMEFFYDPSAIANAGGPDNLLAQSQTMTITYPTGATIAGIGRLTDLKLGHLANDEVSVGSLQFTYLGGSASAIAMND